MRVELPLPPQELRLTTYSDERYRAHAAELAQQLFRLGLRPDSRLLDVGCSAGRLPIGLLGGTDFRGSYVGFDVMRKQIRWARTTLTPLAPSLTFRHIDVRNDRYNPTGAVRPDELRFPVDDAEFDVASLLSVFTHFYAADIAHYLRELRRVIKPGGLVIATWFSYNDMTLDRARGNDSYPMTHRLDDVTIYTNADDPLRAIAFDETYVRGLIRAAGLELDRLEYGRWNGGAGPEFQDVLVLRRPEATRGERLRIEASRALRRARRVAGRVKRRVRAELRR